MKVRLNNVRLAFPQLWEAKAVNGEGEPAFSASFIFPPNHPDKEAKLDKAIEDVAAEKWPGKHKEILKMLKAADKALIHNGDGKDYDGYEGNLYVSARTKTRPTVLDQTRAPLTQSDGKPYGGCYVNVVLDVWPQDNQYGKRVNATLSGVQFSKDGEAFGGGRPAKVDDFDEVEVESSADLL